MAKKMMNQMRSCEAEPEARMARPSDTLPFSVYTVALTACTAQQGLAPPGHLNPCGHKAGLCGFCKSRSSRSQNQLSCMHKYSVSRMSSGRIRSELT